MIHGQVPTEYEIQEEIDREVAQLVALFNLPSESEPEECTLCASI